MKKVFKVADIRKLERQVSLGEISYSRMVEILNERAEVNSLASDEVRIIQDLVQCVRFTWPRSNGLNEAYYKAKELLNKRFGIKL